MAGYPPTPPGSRTPSCPFSSQRAAAMLYGLGAFGGSVGSRCAVTSAQPDCERPISALMAACASELEADEDAQQGAGGSRKDKSLGLLCDNFLQLFASGRIGATIELEAVADKLGVGRRRIYDIVNVLESLEVVQKGVSGKYTWLGLSCLPACVERLDSEWAGPRATPVVPLVDELCDKENGGAAPSAESRGVKDERARKEKSIRELAVKFIGIFMQAAVSSSHKQGALSLEQAARSLLVHERGGAEPDSGAMKTKVRRLYDICNVLCSMKMLTKVKLASAKPAFCWLGVTAATERVFDGNVARQRVIRKYGGTGVDALMPSVAGSKRPSASDLQEDADQATRRSQFARQEAWAQPPGRRIEPAPPQLPVATSLATAVQVAAPLPSGFVFAPQAVGTVVHLRASLPPSSPRIGHLVPRPGSLSFAVPEPSPMRRFGATPPQDEANDRRLSEASTAGAPTPQPMAPLTKRDARTPNQTPGTASAALLCLAGMAPASAFPALHPVATDHSAAFRLVSC